MIPLWRGMEIPLWLWIGSHYATLRIDPGASDEEVRKAWKAKVLEHHPDHNPDRIAAARWWFAECDRAYKVLSDPTKRREHDVALNDKLEARRASDIELERLLKGQRRPLPPYDLKTEMLRAGADYAVKHGVRAIAEWWLRKK